MTARGRTHAATMRAHASRSRRVRTGFVVLGTLAVLAVFADFVASATPLVELGRAHVRVLGLDVRRGPEATADAAPARLWALVRFGPTTAAAAPLAAPSREHPLGTDEHGRDVLARLVHGTRNVLGASALAVALSLVLGLLVGGLAGYADPRWDRRLERVVQAVDTFPAVVVVAVLRAAEERPSLWPLVVGVGVVKWAEVARVVRAAALRLAVEDFVIAARAIGASRRRILLKHVLPHVEGPVAVSAALGLGSSVLLESAVSFLGIGPPIGSASWGEMLAEAARHPEQPWLLLGPTVLVGLTVGAAYLVADSLRDGLDPRAVRVSSSGADALRAPLASEPRAR